MGACCCKREIPPSPFDKGEARNCTDIISLVIFILFWVGLILIGAWALSVGDPFRLWFGADSYGNTCGRSNQELLPELRLSGQDLRGRPRLFPMDPLQPSRTIWICVQHCPDADIYNPHQLQAYARESGVELCRYDVPVADYANESKDGHPLIANSNIGPCPVLPLYRSSPVLNRCIPDLALESIRWMIRGVFGFLNGQDLFSQILGDVMAAGTTIVICLLAALLCSLALVLLLRFLAAFIVYAIFAVTAISALGATAAVWYAYYMLHWSLDAREAASNGTQLLRSEAENEHSLLVYAIIASSITAFLLLCVCCCWGSAQLVVELFTKAGECLQALPSLLFQPLLTCLVLAALLAAWLIVLLSLATAKGLSPGTIGDYWSGGAIVAHVVEWNESLPVRAVWWYHIAGLVWSSEFILAAQQMVVAGAVAQFYFARDKDSLGWPVCLSLRRTLLYHTGSLALGSLLITLVKLPRLLLMWIKAKLEANKGKCLGCCINCCICCLYGVEKCLRYIHHNAYTIIAMEGQSFCPAAQQAVQILANNVLNVTAINAVGDLVLFLAKISVTALTAILAIFLLQRNPELHFSAVPLLLICIGAFFIAHCFFSVYEMAIDTLFLCYCADRERADSTGVSIVAHPSLIAFMRRCTTGDLSRQVSNVVTVIPPEELPLNDA